MRLYLCIFVYVFVYNLVFSVFHYILQYFDDDGDDDDDDNAFNWIKYCSTSSNVKVNKSEGKKLVDL